VTSRRLQAPGRDLQRDLREQRRDIERRVLRVSEREKRVDQEARAVEARAREVAEAEQAQHEALEQLAGLSAEEARSRVVESIEADAKRQAVMSAHALERAVEEEAEERARRVLATAIQRLASEQTSESVVSLVHLATDDMKGRIIGREGRNIRSFEQVTGVNLVIDDTPEAVLLSCFDPVRREVARLTLEGLLSDGRIHPSRIEEQYSRSLSEVERMCVRAGEDAALSLGITDLHPELVATLGRLRYRTSYGQNVLRHLVESGQAAGLLADELGVARATCVRAPPSCTTSARR
jgi:ribonuclease Y